jgi:hypothetical protein
MFRSGRRLQPILPGAVYFAAVPYCQNGYPAVIPVEGIYDPIVAARILNSPRNCPLSVSWGTDSTFSASRSSLLPHAALLACPAGTSHRPRRAQTLHGIALVQSMLSGDLLYRDNRLTGLYCPHPPLHLRDEFFP